MNQQTQNSTKKVLSPKEVVEKLREEAKKNTIFNSVAHIFALRERARGQVTLQSLAATMRREGYRGYTAEDFANVLKFMASVGIGKLDYNPKGRLRSLKGITATLQSVGLAAISKQDTLETFQLTNRYIPLPGSPAAVKKQVEIQEVQEVKDTINKLKAKPGGTAFPAGTNGTYTVALTIKSDGKLLSFDLPRKVSDKELGILLEKLYEKTS